MKNSLAVSAVLTLAILAVSVSATSFEIALSENSVSSCPCTANEIRMEVQNLYRDADTIKFSLNLPDGWDGRGFVQKDVMLGSGEIDRIPIYITPPCDAADGEYFVTLIAESGATGDKTSQNIAINVIKCHFVSLEADENYRDICQEDDDGRIFDVTIENQGKITETFSVSADVDWAVFSDSSVTLGSDEEETLELMINPPEDVSGIREIIIAAKSESSHATAEEKIIVNIENCFEFQASLTPAGDGASAGDLPSVSTGEPDDGSGADGTTGMATADGDAPFESLIVAVIIIIVVLLIIYILVKK